MNGERTTCQQSAPSRSLGETRPLLPDNARSRGGPGEPTPPHPDSRGGSAASPPSYTCTSLPRSRQPRQPRQPHAPALGAEQQAGSGAAGQARSPRIAPGSRKHPPPPWPQQVQGGGLGGRLGGLARSLTLSGRRCSSSSSSLRPAARAPWAPSCPSHRCRGPRAGPTPPPLPGPGSGQAQLPLPLGFRPPTAAGCAHARGPPTPGIPGNSGELAPARTEQQQQPPRPPPPPFLPPTLPLLVFPGSGLYAELASEATSFQGYRPAQPPASYKDGAGGGRRRRSRESCRKKGDIQEEGAGKGLPSRNRAGIGLGANALPASETGSRKDPDVIWTQDPLPPLLPFSGHLPTCHCLS
ncbi:uncharacterized protein [Notamacropus eugenii]|uniref:uncharacterized protein n=1 Tax=Notamacropus eugenii TaxID=9315 RepID=UPI003B67CC5C